MHALHWRQCLAVTVALSLTLLIAGVVGLGAAVQEGVVAPPELDARLPAFHLKAFATNDPACATYLLCAPEHFAVSEQRYYTIWILTRTGQSDWPGGEYETGRRLLLMPLGH